ncbi:MAG TPA: hypothetical protein VD905_06445 [Flavobacteriales bacterium]|nr:hypothetical protein [Flavobacteriales bacterium]
MEDAETLDGPDPKKEQIAEKLMDAHAFWLRRRFFFNAAVGLCGLIPLISFISFFPQAALLGAIIWGLVANGLFSLGYAIESYHIIRSGGLGDLKTTREYMFWMGTLLYCVVTYMTALSFSNSFLVFPFLD